MRIRHRITTAVLSVICIACNLRAESAGADKFFDLHNRLGIAVSINAGTGRYSVTYKGKSWLGPGIISVRVKNQWYRSTRLIASEAAGASLSEGKLVLVESTTAAGNDRWGAYDSVTLTWRVPGAEVRLLTSFRLYQDAPYLVFGQEFPDGFKTYASGNWTVPSVVFPQFLDAREVRHDLYSWISGGMFNHRFGYGTACQLNGTVDLLVLADKDLDALLLSPSANYLVATQQSAPLAVQGDSAISTRAINCGIEGLVEEIPVGFKHENLLVAGEGIDQTFRKWGQALLAKSGKQSPSKYEGNTLRYPVYWDDYGSYYREHGFKEEGYGAYEDVIAGVAEDAKKHGLLIGAYQVQDSDQLRIDEGLFEPRNDLFPRGLAALHTRIGASLEAYICWLTPGGPYRKKYPYIETPKGTVPGKSMGDVFYSLDYWRDTAARLASWGDILLQHDYLNVYEGNPVMMASVDRMDKYFKNMAKALEEKGIKMQYCMQLPRNIMESTENPTVISVQGSHDHHAPMTEPKPKHSDDDPFVWKHLMFADAFYGAVGLWPSRDNIQTQGDPNAWEDLLVANLAGGEIQLGHRIGECNFDLVRKTYREGDELILKADHPLVPLDRCYLEGCAVGYTLSERNGQKWFYVLSLPPAGALGSFRLSDLGLSGWWIAYNYDTGVAAVVDAGTAVNPQTQAKHEYYVVAPILKNGMALIGDTTKFVTMADMRVASVEVSSSDLRVGVISNQEWNPVTVGYADRSPAGVEAGDAKLPEASSLDRLRAAKSGWFYDPLTKLWYVKIDFLGSGRMETRFFTIR
jgi:hypothetical protein